MELEKIRRRMKTPTSKKDLLYMLKGKVRVISYDECLQYNTLLELLGQYEACILLYPGTDFGSDVSDPVGHWCCLFSVVGSKPRRIEYFDPYGSFIDSNIDEINRKHDGQIIPPHIKRLILEEINSGNSEVYWNETVFQSIEVESATCGLHVVLRLKNNHLIEEDYARLYYDVSVNQNILPDLMVSSIILDMYPEMDRKPEEHTELPSPNVEIKKEKEGLKEIVQENQERKEQKQSDVRELD